MSLFEDSPRIIRLTCASGDRQCCGEQQLSCMQQHARRSVNVKGGLVVGTVSELSMPARQAEKHCPLVAAVLRGRHFDCPRYSLL